MKLQVIILAGGQGTRMRSNRPKVLHELAGMPILERIINTATSLEPDKTFVVVGHHASQVKQALSHCAPIWVEQTEQLGTGHALQQVLPLVDDDAHLLILYG